MATFREMFSAPRFRSTVERYCAQIGWRIAEIDDRKAVIKFKMNSGRSQTLYIIRYDTTLEFSVPSIAAFDGRDDVPHLLSTMLLERNAANRIGFWCIETIAGKQVFSYMHNAEMELLNTEYFERVVQLLIRECDDFEGAMLDMLE